jgi:hypothetical protein
MSMPLALMRGWRQYRSALGLSQTSGPSREVAPATTCHSSATPLYPRLIHKLIRRISSRYVYFRWFVTLVAPHALRMNPQPQTDMLVEPDSEPEVETDIDMDRVVADPDYRRRVIGRLRHDWRVAETLRQALMPADDAALADSEAADPEDD